MATIIIPSKAFGVRAKRSQPRSLWTRIYEAMLASRQREADAVVARHMAGRWTDAVERQVNEELIKSEMHRLF